MILSNESFILKSDLISRQNTKLFKNVKTFLRLFNYVEQNEYRVMFLVRDVCKLITFNLKHFSPNSLLRAHGAQLPTTSITWFYHSAVAETL